MQPSVKTKIKRNRTEKQRKYVDRGRKRRLATRRDRARVAHEHTQSIQPRYKVKSTDS